jgi:hypothetical protein
MALMASIPIQFDFLFSLTLPFRRKVLLTLLIKRISMNYVIYPANVYLYRSVYLSTYAPAKTLYLLKALKLNVP